MTISAHTRVAHRMPKQVTRTEVVSEWCQEASFDDEGVIKDVLLCGNSSRNGYGIPAKAFGNDEKARTLYEGKMIFFNHNPDRPRMRDLKTDLAGVIRNVRIRDGKPRGDIDTRLTPAGSLLWNMSKISPSPKDLGLSHVAKYRFDDRMENVEEVDQVVSVDVVMTPATTNTLYEQVRDLDFEQELKTVRGERDKHATDLQAAKERILALEQSETTLKEQVATLSTECEQHKQAEKDLKLKVDQFESAQALNERKAAIEAELKAAGFDPSDKAVVTPVFLEQLQGLGDEAARKSLIEDRASFLKEAAPNLPGARERKPQGAKEFNPNDYFATLGL